MDIPASGMVDHFGRYLYKPPDDPVYGWLGALAPECGIPDRVEQIISKTSYEGAGLAANSTLREVRLVPSQSVLPLFYPVFNSSPAIVDRDHHLRFKIRVGHNKSDTRGK